MTVKETNKVILRALALKEHATHSTLQRDLYRAAEAAANHLMGCGA